jgi:periplasmic divalent cation tolerance protein
VTGLISVYITAPDAAAAEAIGRALVEEQLAACANVLPGAVSLYRWEGAVQREQEAVLLLKTRAELFDALAARARALHPYEVPCVVAWPIVAESAEYGTWIRAQTAGGS